MEAAFPGYYTSAFPKEYVPKLNFLKDSVGSKKGWGGLGLPSGEGQCGCFEYQPQILFL